MVLLASAHYDLKNALGQFAAKSEAARIKVNTSESETLDLNWKNIKHLGILFKNEGEVEHKYSR